jgi:hypothetical protein
LLAYLLSTNIMAKTTPRISVNKLAEYIESTPPRRKKIVYDAKHPVKYIVTRYGDVRDIIAGYFKTGQDEEFLLKAIADFEKRVPETEFQEQDIALSIESLELFLETDTSPLDGCEVSPYLGENHLVNIAGVDISVNPDLIITKRINANIQLGAAKLHLSKSNYLSTESQEIVALMLHNYANDYMLGSGEVANPKLSVSIDVFNQTIECCPKAFKTRMKFIYAACEEIALRWPTL